MSNKVDSQLRFDGSLWCNLDIALRNLDQIFDRVVQPLGLTIIEWYILRALYERDGQHASELARAVGRAATSFTPNLDKLQQKGLIERRPDPTDRRAVHIVLTPQAEQYRADILRSAEVIDMQLAHLLPGADFEAFLRVVSLLQNIEHEQLMEVDVPVHANGNRRNGRRG
ncbi:MarR family transcriptional regulator [Geitlerinema splendidum]|jgi:DNA-binding MarR family transcriptional regulator|nr:MarR family transcriptional regulator [Geitlerinema splendidum]